MRATMAPATATATTTATADPELTVAALELLAAPSNHQPSVDRLSVLSSALATALRPPHARIHPALRALAAVVALRPAAHAVLIANDVVHALLRAATIPACAASSLNILAALLSRPPPNAVAAPVPTAVAQIALPLLRAPLLSSEGDAAAAASLRVLAALARITNFSTCRALSDRTLLRAVHSALLRAVHTSNALLISVGADFMVALLSGSHLHLRPTLSELRMSHLFVRALHLQHARPNLMRYFAALLQPPCSIAEIPHSSLLPQLVASLTSGRAQELMPAIHVLSALPNHLISPPTLVTPLVQVLPRLPLAVLPQALALLTSLLADKVQVAKHAYTAQAASSLSEAIRPHTANISVMHPALLALRQLIHCYDRNRAAVVSARLAQVVLLVLVEHARNPTLVAAAANVFILLSPADLAASQITVASLSNLLHARLALHNAHVAAAPALTDLLDALALAEVPAATNTPVVETPAPRTLSNANLLRRRTATTRRVVSDFDVRRLAHLDVPTRSAKRARKTQRLLQNGNEPSQEPLADLLARHRAQPPGQLDIGQAPAIRAHSHLGTATQYRSQSSASQLHVPDDGPSSAPIWPISSPSHLPNGTSSFDTLDDSDEDASDYTSNGSFSMSASDDDESFEDEPLVAPQSRQPSELNDVLRTISDMQEPQSASFSTSIAGLPVRKRDVRESSTVTSSAENMDESDIGEESEFPDLASRVFQRAYAKQVAQSEADILYGSKRYAERERNHVTGARPQWSIWPFHSTDDGGGGASLRLAAGRSHTRGESGTIRGRR